MRRTFAILLVVASVPFLSAAQLAPPVRAEIDALLSALQTSGCEFYRNGSWHDAAAAKSHLLRKLRYLERKNLVTSTEQFIDLGASGSSTSGKPYLVRCGDSAPVESKVWLSTQLKSIRAAGSASRPESK
jgi:hypothetical protein